VIELEVVGVTARPMSDEHRQQLRHAAQPFPGQPAPPPDARRVEAADVPAWEHEVRLTERAGDRVLDFGIGQAEAVAIGFGLQGHREPRPLTHDFIGDLLEALDDVSVRRLVITKRTSDGTFHAEIEVQQRERVLTVDCRPSDGIALAVRLGVPIMAADELEPVLAAA
jgi:bifunctional DNase/RNase